MAILGGNPRTVRNVQSRLLQQLSRFVHAFGTFTGYAVSRFWNDDGLRVASALTYSSLLAMVPLTTITVAILSVFPAFAEIRAGVQTWVFNLLVPEVGTVVLNYLEGYSSNAGRLTALSILGLVLTSLLLLATIENAFNHIWKVKEQRTLVVRLITFWALLTLTPLLVAASFSATLNLYEQNREALSGQFWLPFIGFVPLTLQFVGFAALYQMIPNRPVRLLDSIVGGAVAAVLFEISKRLFAWYLQAAPIYETIYGALSTIPIFLFWVYVAWSIVLFGAYVAAALPDWRAGRLVGGQVDDLLAGPRLTIALAILAELYAASRLGVGLSRMTLADRVPVGSATLDGMMHQLRRARFVDRSASDSWLLVRDLASATLADLMRGLGIGMRGPVGGIAGIEGAWVERLRQAMRQTDSAAEPHLGVPLATIFQPPTPPANRASGEVRVFERRHDPATPPPA
jgi:membrane protein